MCTLGSLFCCRVHRQLMQEHPPLQKHSREDPSRGRAKERLLATTDCVGDSRAIIPCLYHLHISLLPLEQNCSPFGEPQGFLQRVSPGLPSWAYSRMKLDFAPGLARVQTSALQTSWPRCKLSSSPGGLALFAASKGRFWVAT